METMLALLTGRLCSSKEPAGLEAGDQRRLPRLFPEPTHFLLLTSDLGVELGLMIVVVHKRRMDLGQGEPRVLEVDLF